MSRFIKQFNRKLNSSVLQLNCCHSLAMAAEQLTAAMITLPGDINILIPLRVIFQTLTAVLFI